MADQVVVTNIGVFSRVGLMFQYLAAKIDTDVKSDIQMDIAKFVLKRAQELVPVRTGALRNSGRIAMTSNRKGLEVRFGTSRVRYAMVVEFGRMAYAPFPPKPYIRPAVQAAQKKWQQAAKASFVKAKRSTFPRVIR
tara:strand:- start:19166 stop:19576 length:411 start_codon:yes stop_codon:yes gene_type:complete